MTADHQLSAYQYDLPESLIAQNPLTPRDSSRLLLVDTPTTHQHRYFRQLPEILQPGDLLILNNTRVIPARLFGNKQSPGQRAPGAAVEVLLIEPVSADRWLALVKPGRRLQPGSTLVFGDPAKPKLIARVEARDEATAGRILHLIPGKEDSSDSPRQVANSAGPLPDLSHRLMTLIEELGQVPLPPYITDSDALAEQYQTVYAQRQGAVAAPTAGLHFTERLLQQLAQQGIHTAQITLHVGIGTFRPVEVSDITTHAMHQERIEIPEATVEKIRQTQAAGGRVIAVGTTSTRALEGVAARFGALQPFQGKTELFIYPGYRWQVIDGLITNFHLPGSSLLMLVSALIGRERLMEIYADAIAQAYRFYSFGDAMLILPEARAPHGI